jgi:hypothetical protein
MKTRLLLLSLLACFVILLGVVIVMSVAATAAPVTSSGSIVNITSSAVQPVTQNREIPARVTTSPRQSTRGDSGEVENPMTPQPTPTPTISRTTVPVTPTIPPPTTVPPTPTISSTTVPATPTIPPTTIPPTPTTPVPVVTVTILVYPSGQVYQPVYYYPPYYPYTIDSYYPRGTLTVTSNPSQATVILDGYNTGTTPWIFTGLTTGYHTMEVNYPGYEAYVRSVYVENGANPSVYADLTSLVNYGSFFIESTPSGADVYVDGNYQGTSPVSVGGMSVGAHRIELHLAGYEVLTTSRTVAPSQGTVVNLVLTPLSTFSDYGSIDIISATPGALVYLDGIYKGSIISGTTFSIISVSPGPHTILIHAPGYADITRPVQVEAGQIATVDASSPSTYTTGSTAGLQSSASSSTAPGTIVVTSTPAGGQVTVDNQFRGVAPVTIYNVAPGTHIVNMKLAGYSDWSSSVDVPSNQMAQVHATLAPGSTLPVPTRPGLSPFAILGAFAVVAVVVAYRFRR